MKVRYHRYKSPYGDDMIQLSSKGPKGWLITDGKRVDLPRLEREHKALVKSAFKTVPERRLVTA